VVFCDRKNATIAILSNEYGKLCSEELRFFPIILKYIFSYY
jgi:hypothetical protein